MIAVQPSLKSCMDNDKVHSQNVNPFTCFELLGFDILLTENLDPYLLEVRYYMYVFIKLYDKLHNN